MSIIAQDQYRFVYQVMNEAIAVGNTALPCSDLGKTLFTLIDDGSLERQFQVCYHRISRCSTLKMYAYFISK